MKFPVALSIHSIAKEFGCSIKGEDKVTLSGISEIHNVSDGDLIFVDHPKYYDKALKSKASAVIINKDVEVPNGKAILLTEHPFRVFNDILKRYKPHTYFQENQQRIDSSAIIMPNVSIGKEVSIGAGSIIHPNVIIYDGVQIGRNVIVQAGTVLGSNAFYYNKKNDNYHLMHSAGGLIIEDYVEIGSLCSIDKGVTANTIIKSGSKLDNQIQIGHDCVIEENCLIAAQCGIAGCVTIQKNCVLWGQVGVTSGVTIGNNSVILGQTAVTKSLSPDKTYSGDPATPYRTNLKQKAAVKQLPDFLEGLKKK
ncbi:MAG: UDP-3-O-(3-hydroxymyristoyl)glucosamine N-acyltransferase [Flavobacteriaceae bacterium]|nr:UDP-3-O-(3-hydroxymyristoyl)glucosamine N-acyltransferase [Flavobacteriaceae bacterium]